MEHNFSADAMRRRFAEAERILVVCLGNICRSPFAAAVLRSKLGDRAEVREGGYLPKMNRPVPEVALTVQKQLGYDLSRHRSRHFTDDDLAWADLILCFDQENDRYLREKLGEATEKVWPLGAVLSETSPWIADPYDRPADVYRETYRFIIRCCEELLEQIKN